jgi:hypothetical protein
MSMIEETNHFGSDILNGIFVGVLKVNICSFLQGFEAISSLANMSIVVEKHTI